MTFDNLIDTTKIDGSAIPTPETQNASSVNVSGRTGAEDKVTSNGYQQPIVTKTPSVSSPVSKSARVKPQNEAIIESLLTIRRLTGLDWEEMADLFSVSRRSIGKWVSGRLSSDKYNIINTASVIEDIDLGGQEENRAMLMNKANPEAVSLYELLKQGKFELVKECAPTGPKVRRATPVTLSAAEQRLRRPPHPAVLLGQLADRSEMEEKARPDLFSPMPLTRRKNK